MTKVVIATTTFYKSMNELRFHLACNLVEKAVADGHVVVVVDGSPIRMIAEKLSEFGALVYPQFHRGMGPSRREAFFHAWEVAVEKEIPFILWTEPEKVDLIRSIKKIINPLWLDADIVIARRSVSAWETWPVFQRESEEQANKVYNEVFDKLLCFKHHDPMFGVVAFHLGMAKHFVLCRSKMFNWSPDPDHKFITSLQELEDTYIQHYAPPFAHFYENAQIDSIEIDMVYPPEQRKEEEGMYNDEMLEKRKWQLETLSNAYRAIAIVLKPKGGQRA